VVLAMPDPQARRLLDPDGPHAGLRAALDVEYDPVIAVAAEWPDREWAFADGVFVNHHPVLTFLADDGARRGDGVPVLVAHTTAAFAADHLSGAPDDVAAAQALVIAAVTELLALPAAPRWAHARRWTTAKPAGAHVESYAWSGPPRPGSGGIGVAGDAWCPSGSPRVESAWLSGDALGRRIVSESAVL
jgi:predicted NAD/FAD-dependent oxidoreductase